MQDHISSKSYILIYRLIKLKKEKKNNDESVTIVSITKNSKLDIKSENNDYRERVTKASIRPSTEADAAGISIIFDANYGYSKHYVERVEVMRGGS